MALVFYFHHICRGQHMECLCMCVNGHPFRIESSYNGYINHSTPFPGIDGNPIQLFIVACMSVVSN